LLGENVSVAKRKAKWLLVPRKEACPGENTEKISYTLELSEQNWVNYCVQRFSKEVI